MRRTLTALLAALLLGSLLLPVAAGAQTDEEVVVRVGLHNAEKNLNPFIVPRANPITHDFTMLVYDTLFWSQARVDPEPWLATGAEASDDFRTWTVSLRDGVEWHDGMPFTAEDVAFTFQFTSDYQGPSRYAHHITDHPTFVSANVIDDLTVELNFEDPIPSFELLPGGDMPILAKHIWEGNDDPGADATGLPIGTGPFRMTEYVPDTSYVLEANEDYFKGAPTVDRLIMPVIRDSQAAFAGLQTGELDFVTRNLPSNLQDSVNDDADLEIIEGTRFQSTYFMFNTRKPALDDPDVRKAMSLALDVDEISEIVEGGLGRPGNDTWTHPDSPFAHPTGGHEFDPEAAATLFDDAGFPVGDGGTRVGADGTALEFTLLVNSVIPPQIRAGELVAEQLAPLGIDITVEPLDGAALSEMRRPGPDGPPTFDMSIGAFESHAHADPDALFFFFHTPGEVGVGGVFSGYANPEFDAILEENLSLPIDEKAEALVPAQEIFAEEAPAVTLSYPDGRWAYRPAAYDGWISDPGHGVFTKRSFLEEYANVAGSEPVEAAAGDDGGDGDGDGFPIVPVAAVVIALLAGGAALVARNRKGTGTVED